MSCSVSCPACRNVSLLFAGKTYHQPIAQVKADPVGAGLVYVSIDANVLGETEMKGNYYEDRGGTTTDFYFTAEHASNDYLWYRWENHKGVQVSRDKKHTLALSYNSGSTHGGTSGSYKITETQNGQSGESEIKTYTMPFTAKWVQPDVTGVTNGVANGPRQSTYDMGTITDPTATTTTSVAFTLSNDYAGLLDINNVCPDYYSIATTLNSNGYTNGAMSHTKGSGSLTVPVTYTPTGVHNQTNSASLVVKSNYPSSGANSWTVVLNVKEDYKPSFTLDASSYNFTPTQPISNAASSGAYTLPISGRNYAASNIAKWGVSWSAVTYDGGTAYPNTNPYSVDVTNIDNPKVIFTAPATGSYKDVTAKLTITAKYKDANGILIESEPKIITFSADAGEQLTINDEHEYTMDFGVIDFGKAYTDEVELISTYLDLTESLTNPVAGITFNTDVANEKVVVSIADNTAIGDYSPSLTLSKGALSVVLNVKAQVKLAKPIVTSTTGLGQSIDLSWSAVNGATSYIVKSGETIVATIGDDETIATTYKVTAIGGKSLVMGTEYPFTITAVYEPNTFGNRTSDEIKVTPTAPATITSTTELDLYTGTDKYQEGHATYGKYPYAPKRKIDLSAAFNNGVAAFDQLFVFGLTIGNADGVVTVPTATANANAVTPCYIYTKSGDNYVLSSSSIDNVNVATKPAAFNISANGQKIYFTGYAPYASCGSTWDENAVFLFTGNGKAVDVYFDNLELYARPKAVTGTTVPIKKYTVASFNDAMGLLGDKDVNLDLGGPSLNVYVQGSGAAFAFAST